jgi:hypothetical protein
MDPGRGVIGQVRRLVDSLTAAKTYLAVLHRRLHRGAVTLSEVEQQLVLVEQQLDAAAEATEDVKRALERTVESRGSSG